LDTIERRLHLNSNDFKAELSATLTSITLPFLNSPGSIKLTTPTSDFLYPCTVWVNPSSGSTVSVTTSFDQIDQVPWSNGTVSAAASEAFLSCPGTITFNLVTGTSATVGVT